MRRELIIIGGGLAGSEAAYQVAERGIFVSLYEMRPDKLTPAHRTGLLAELVCSNSLRSDEIHNAVGLLKKEMRGLGSLIMDVADRTRVPAGSALAVDREAFAGEITRQVTTHPNIKVIRKEMKGIPEETPTIIATGPLTSEAMTDALKKITQSEYLYFYDAISPIIDAETIDYDIAFRASRYAAGGDDYINCPVTEDEYNLFYDAFMSAEKYKEKEFEDIRYFEGCMPIEVMAERGRETLLHGPMKPVGLTDPRTGKRPYAVVQLRKENLAGTAYNIVGFQTKLKWGEQKRIFRMIPGLGRAEFLRYGSLHRNTFINSPLFLKETLQFKFRDDLFLAGQISGVEGYVESATMGFLCGINAARFIYGKDLVVPPPTTACGSLVRHITKGDSKNFQPMNVNWGLFPPLSENIRDRAIRNKRMSERALTDLEEWKTKSLNL